jgi:DNA polymerase type B, organellar and viral
MEKILITKKEYNKLSYSNWSFREELSKYNINDCIVLYNVMEKFDEWIKDQFNLDMCNNPTLSSLAFSIYRLGYIPESLFFSELIEKGDKTIEMTTTDIDSLNSNFDSSIRQGYFGGHVDSYIPHF